MFGYAFVVIVLTALAWGLAGPIAGLVALVGLIVGAYVLALKLGDI